MTEPEILLGFRFFPRFNRGNRSGELEREVLPRARVVTRARAVNFRALFRPQTTLLTCDLLVSLDWLPSFAHCSLVIKSSRIEIILKTVFWPDSELQKRKKRRKKEKEKSILIRPCFHSRSINSNQQYREIEMKIRIEENFLDSNSFFTTIIQITA